MCDAKHFKVMKGSVKFEPFVSNLSKIFYLWYVTQVSSFLVFSSSLGLNDDIFILLVLLQKMGRYKYLKHYLTYSMNKSMYCNVTDVNITD